MKRATSALWVMESDARYARILSSGCGPATADVMGNKRKMVSFWQSSGKTLRLTTAHCLQRTAWWFSQ